MTILISSSLLVNQRNLSRIPFCQWLCTFLHQIKSVLNSLYFQTFYTIIRPKIKFREQCRKQTFARRSNFPQHGLIADNDNAIQKKNRHDCSLSDSSKATGVYLLTSTGSKVNVGSFFDWDVFMWNSGQD